VPVGNGTLAFQTSEPPGAPHALVGPSGAWPGQPPLDDDEAALLDEAVGLPPPPPVLPLDEAAGLPPVLPLDDDAGTPPVPLVLPLDATVLPLDATVLSGLPEDAEVTGAPPAPPEPPLMEPEHAVPTADSTHPHTATRRDRTQCSMGSHVARGTGNIHGGRTIRASVRAPEDDA
jgi:hypothetical protein